MILKVWKIFRIIFHLICFTATVFCTYKCYTKYQQNHSSFEIKFGKFHQDDNNLYPSISMCFSMPFKSEKLDQYMKGITNKNYSDFLLGNNNREKLFEVGYEDVSLQINDFFVQSKIRYTSKNISNDRKFENVRINATMGISALNSWFLKCFTLNVPFKKHALVSALIIKINRDIFPNGTRPMDAYEEPFGLSIYYHLPNQFLRSDSTKKVMWNATPRSNPKSYGIVIHVSNVEVLETRKRNPESCTEEARYDDWLLAKICM